MAKQKVIKRNARASTNRYFYAPNGSKLYTKEQLKERSIRRKIEYANDDGGCRTYTHKYNKSRTREFLDERNRLRRLKYANDKEYRKKNIADRKAWGRLETSLEWARQYRRDNSEKLNKRWRDDYYKKKKEVYNLLGNKCVNCGEDDPIYLQIDHVNNDGYIERAQKNGRQDIYVIKKYLETPERYQLLCANCNWAKRMNDGKLYKPKKKKKAA